MTTLNPLPRRIYLFRRRRRIERILALVIWSGFLFMFFLMLLGFVVPLYYRLATEGKPGGRWYDFPVLITSGVSAGIGVIGLLTLAVFKLWTWLVPIRRQV